MPFTRQLFTSAYDCSIRTVSLLTGLSSAIYALPDPDALINHFDISPSGKEIWAVDSLGGLNHVDMREDDKQWGRRRWVITGQNTNTKIGGIGIDRESSCLLGFLPCADTRIAKNPALICTASNDRTMRYVCQASSCPAADCFAGCGIPDTFTR